MHALKTKRCIESRLKTHHHINSNQLLGRISFDDLRITRVDMRSTKPWEYLKTFFWGLYDGTIINFKRFLISSKLKEKLIHVCR